MAENNENRNEQKPHAAPSKSLVDKVIESALGIGGGAVTLLSGLLAAVLILYSGYVLYDTFATERAASSNAWDLLRFKPEIMDDYETPLSGSELEAINKDYRAWLTVYDTNIDYPVVQGRDDLYYASHDIYNRNSLTGAIYLAAGNSGDFSDTYNLIYGHHMDNGAMFGALDHMSGNETGTIVTKDAIYDIQFFAMIDTDAYESRIYSVGNRMNDVLDFLRSGGEGGVGVGTTVRYFNESVAADAEKLIALSTCANANTSGRLVVIGKVFKRVVMKDITVIKVWDDRDDQDGIRPASITVTASDGTTAQLNAENNWTATVSVRKYDSQGEITYTWEEKELRTEAPGYTLVSAVTEGDTTTLTNRHEAEVTSVSVRKIWDDDGNRDGIRPESITVTLSDGQTATLSEANGWAARIDHLPKFAEGEEITYSWTEASVEGYTTTSVTEGDTTTLTNRHEPETRTATITKIWDDDNNRDGIRPETLTVTLRANGTTAATETLSAENGWTATVTGLPAKENGEAIAYTWTEETPAGYTLTDENTEETADGTTTTLTNRHATEEKSLTITKIWDDDNNRDGVRPRNLTVWLNNGQRVTLNEGNGWTGTIEHLPIHDSGAEIEYSWTEDEIRGYTLSGTAENGDTTLLTNRHESETTVATVTKVWNDADNRDGIRPAAITATLNANGNAIQSVTLNAENGWTATIENLPVNEDGNPIAYSWSEEAVSGYTAVADVSGTTTTLINTHETETVDLTVTKVWEDGENQDGIRPAAITAVLSANGNAIRNVTLNAGNGWTATVTGLPANEGGQAIAYSWTEEAADGYTLSTATEGTATTLINTHIPETTSATVRKIWDDDNDRDGIRPESLSVQLSNGTQVTLNAENDWTATVENLPVYRNGETITYSWVERSVTGYTLTDVSSENTAGGSLTTLTNTHTPEVTSLTINKVWDDEEDRDRIRPSIVSVTLLANGNPAGTATLNSANGWSATFDNLPIYAEGETIAYSWAEAEISGYTGTMETRGSVTTLTNTHEPEDIELTVTKVWNDDNNRDGIRPDQLAVTLTGNGTAISTATLNEENNWTATVTVPANERGQAIAYAWNEENVRGYSSSSEVNGNTTILTNTHEPDVTERTIQKEWEDDNDRDGVRPEGLTVYLLANGEVLETITLSAENAWTYTAQNLNVYQNGEGIRYSWSEERPAGYPYLRTATNGSVTTLTNVHEPEMTERTVHKVWDDGNNQDGIRPETLAVTLRANGEAIQTVTLSEENGWFARIENLPLNAGGEPIAYTWTEDTVVGYTLSTTVNGTDTLMTNTHETERTIATVTKVWDDDGNRDGVRPRSLTVRLSNGTTATLNEENHWTATIENLPKYRNGQEIGYTWTEDAIEGYTLVSIETEGTVTTITNRHEIATREITVRKVWDDENNRDGIRPGEIIAILNNGDRVALNADNGWTATIAGLPVYVGGGREINYVWSEDAVNGYTLVSSVTEGNVTTLTNRHEAETTEVGVTKIWDDNENQDGVRPAAVTVTLNANGTPIRTVTLNAAGNWSTVIGGLPRSENGTAVNYTWTEAAIAGYTLTNTSTAVNEAGVAMTTLTNTHTPATVSLSIRKIWVDEDASARPATLRMVLSGNGEAIPVTLSAANNWTATVNGLARYAGGQEIAYRWNEPAVTGYEQTGRATNGNTTTITNTRVRTEETETQTEHRLTIYYRYLDGSEAAPTIRETHVTGDAYNRLSPEIDGYRESVQQVDGVMPDHDVVYTVIYVPGEGYIMIDDFEMPLGLGQVFINVGDCLE